LGARLDFTLEGAGWASLEISDGDFECRLGSISYATDALDDLLRMGIDIATDKGWSAAEFELEPGSIVLIAETGWWEDGKWNRGARLSSYESPKSPGGRLTWNQVHESSRDFIVTVDSRDQLAQLFLDAARRVLEKYGEDGYRKLWSGSLGYPRRAVAALEAALSTQPCEVTPYG
jgi:hypothetical protein